MTGGPNPITQGVLMKRGDWGAVTDKDRGRRDCVKGLSSCPYRFRREHALSLLDLGFAVARAVRQRIPVVTYRLWCFEAAAPN